MFICMHIWVALTGLNELFEKKKKRHEPGESVRVYINGIQGGK